MTEEFIIPLNGLKPGKTVFSWHVGADFFREFGNEDILDANLEVRTTVEKSGTYIGIDCNINGMLTVPCDRCMDDVSLPVTSDARLSVKFGSEPTAADEIVVSDEREVVYLPEDEAEMDMSQIIYDFAYLSLPMQRVHKNGECNPNALKYLSSAGGKYSEKTDTSSGNNPFAVLKGLMDEK